MKAVSMLITQNTEVSNSQIITHFFVDPIVLGVPNSKIAKDIEDAIMKAGGLGRFQIWSFFVIVTGMVSGAFWLYSLQYFERVPQEWFCKETE